MNNVIHRLTAGAACIVTVVSMPILATEAPEIDHPSQAIELPTSQLIKKDLFAGTGYELDPTVTIYRSRAFYELKGPDGREVIVSTRQLLTRVDELRAVAALQKMKKTDVYGEALKNAGMAPVELAEGLVTEPVDTVGRVGRGVGGFFSDVGYALVGDDDDQDSVAKTALGHDAAKRAFAFELGVNPYSDFEPLQDELSEVAWTAVGGNLTVSVGFRAIGGTPGTVLSMSKLANGMRKLVRDLSPRELRAHNAEKLKAMGVGESLAEAFLSNRNFDPETETRLVGALDSMKKVPGRALFIQRAAVVDTPGDARMMRDWVELMAAYHEEIQKIVEIVMVSKAPHAVVEGRIVFGIFPADFFTPTPGLRGRLQEMLTELKQQGLTPGQIWTTGDVDPKAEELAKELGWAEIKSRVEEQLYAQK